MKILMLMLTIMTFFIESKNKVSMDGTWPYDIEVSYANTYQKGQVRKDDTAKIELNNLGNIVIQRITAHVKSNQSSGAGQWTVSVNGNTVASKVGSFKDWVGAYDNTAFHPIELLSAPTTTADQLSIELVGITNSLYVEKFEITYEFAPSRTVTLMSGNDLYSSVIEDHPGAGVVLPTLPNQGQWAFVGWTIEPCYEQTQKPNILPLGTYHPVADCTLWAVYTYMPSDMHATNLTSGTYVYANTIPNLAIQGAVQDGKMANASIDLSDPSQYYHIEFTPNADTAFIYHPQSDTYVGYQDKQLVATRTPWLVFHSAEKTLFYMQYGSKNYALWPNVVENISNVLYNYAGLIEATNLEGTSTVLLSVEQLANGPVYTCHPECGLAFPQVEQPANAASYEAIIPFGNYQLKIKNGTKTIEL